MKRTHFKTIAAAILIMVSNFTNSLHADPQITSWLTSYSGQYARIYETDAQLAKSPRPTMISEIP
jgi:hypothetical protein